MATEMLRAFHYDLPVVECDYEVVRGVGRPRFPALLDHAVAAGRLIARLGDFVEAHGLGDVGAGGGFILARDPITLLSPDVSFVRTECVPPPDQRDGFAEFAPDLVAEVLSAFDLAIDVEDRIARYLESGVRRVWLVNPAGRSVVVRCPDTTARLFEVGDTFDGGDVLPGFSLPVAAIFA